MSHWTEQSNLADEAHDLVEKYFQTEKLRLALNKYFGKYLKEKMTINEIYNDIIIRLSEDSDGAVIHYNNVKLFIEELKI